MILNDAFISLAEQRRSLAVIPAKALREAHIRAPQALRERKSFPLEYQQVARLFLRDPRAETRGGKVSGESPTDGVRKAGLRHRRFGCDVRASLPASKQRAIPHPAGFAGHLVSANCERVGERAAVQPTARRRT